MKSTKNIEEILNIERKRFGFKSKLFGLLVLGLSTSTYVSAQEFQSTDFLANYHEESRKLCVDSISYDGTKPKKYDFGKININYDCNGNIISSKYKGFPVPKSKFEELEKKAKPYYSQIKQEISGNLKSKLFLTMLLKKN